MIAVAKALEWPAMSSMLPSLVPPSILARAMAMNSVGGQAAVIVGPTIGGLLYVAGPHVVYGVSGLFYLVSLTLVSLLRYERPVQARLPMNMKNLFAGIHFIRERKDVLGVISLDLFAVLLGGATALLPILPKIFCIPDRGVGDVARRTVGGSIAGGHLAEPSQAGEACRDDYVWLGGGLWRCDAGVRAFHAVMAVAGGALCAGWL